MSEGSTDGPFPLHPTVFLHRVCTFSSAALWLPREALPAHTPFLALPAAPFGGKPRLSSQPKRSALNDSHPPNGHTPVKPAVAPVATQNPSSLACCTSHYTVGPFCDSGLPPCCTPALILWCLGLPCTFAPAPCST